jgi:hypothetical protein
VVNQGAIADGDERAGVPGDVSSNTKEVLHRDDWSDGVQDAGKLGFSCRVR